MIDKKIQLGFWGFGLIGGSIARAIKAATANVSVKVYSRRKNEELIKATDEGIIDNI